MQGTKKAQLAAALAATLGFALHGAANAADTSGSATDTGTTKPIPMAKKGGESNCSGKEGSCSGKKGKSSNCAGKGKSSNCSGSKKGKSSKCASGKEGSCSSKK